MTDDKLAEVLEAFGQGREGAPPPRSQQTMEPPSKMPPEDDKAAVTLLHRCATARSGDHDGFVCPNEHVAIA